jgi:hypothetical protein
VRELQHQETIVTLREQITRPLLAAKRTTMKAIVQDRYGSADVLEFRDIEEPAVGDDDVRIRGRGDPLNDFPDAFHQSEPLLAT